MHLKYCLAVKTAYDHRDRDPTLALRVLEVGPVTLESVGVALRDSGDPNAEADPMELSQEGRRYQEPPGAKLGYVVFAFFDTQGSPIPIVNTNSFQVSRHDCLNPSGERLTREACTVPGARHVPHPRSV